MTDPSEVEDLVLERTFDAPIEAVWGMWTDAEHFKAWYGPPGATIPVARMDLRVGGQRLVCMEAQTPDGPMTMWFAGHFLEIAPNERLVYTEAISDETGAISPADGTDGHPGVTEVRVELAEIGDRTRMILTHVGIPPNSPGATGWTMAFDKFALVLAA